MKFKLGEITRENSFLSHMVLESIGDNKEALKTVTDIVDRDENTEVNVELTFNGVTLDVGKFVTRLEEVWEGEVRKAAAPEARKLFEKMKQDFKSKNSANAQLNRIREQMVKANNFLTNIEQNVELLSTNLK